MTRKFIDLIEMEDLLQVPRYEFFSYESEMFVVLKGKTRLDHDLARTFEDA